MWKQDSTMNRKTVLGISTKIRKNMADALVHVVFP
jgi:hypothetical protein